MHVKFFLGIAVAIFIIFFAAAFVTQLPGAAPAEKDPDTLYQVSTINALMQGAFEGTEPVSETLRHGDFGIGTFDGLDGEMIVVDGVAYRAGVDGRVSAVTGRTTTPFATVTFFSTDRTEKIDRRMNYSELAEALNGTLPSRNMIYAVRMHGTFPAMKVRSIPRQKQPYPTLSEAAKNQVVYMYSPATGTVVGFYMPALMAGLNIPGFHLHFLADDRMTGGHILDMTADRGTLVEYDITPQFTMSLPVSGSFAGVDLSKDLSGELAKVER